MPQPFDDEILSDVTDEPVLPSLPVSRGFMYVGDRQGNLATPPPAGSWEPPDAVANFQAHDRYLQDEANRKAQEQRDLAASMATMKQADQLKFREMAIREAGLRKYEQGIQSGMTPQESYRLNAAEINFNHPGSMAAAMKAAQGTSEFEPRVVTLPDGTKVLQTGPNRSSLIKPPKVAPPPDVTANQKSIQEQIAVTMRDIAKNKEVMNRSGVDDDTKARAARAAFIASQQLADLQNKRQIGSTNWMQAIPPAPTAAPTAAPKQIDSETARALLAEAGGDKQKARELARQRGYSF